MRTQLRYQRGEVIVVKSAVTESDHERLRVECAATQGFPSATVARTLATTEGRAEFAWGGTAELTMATLAGREFLETAARAVRCLGEVHDGGCSHGTIRAEHIVVDDRGSVRFCSLAGARLDATAADRHADRRDMAGLLRARVPLLAGAAAAHIQEMAAELEEVECDMWTLARRLDSLALTYPPRRGRGRAVRSGAARLHLGPLWAGISAVALLVLVGFWWGRVLSRDLTPRSAPVPALPATGSPAAATLRQCPPVRGHLIVRTSTCPTALSVSNTTPSQPPSVAIGERRFALGRAGDVAIAGDVDCDGSADIVLLRPRTGEVFVFRDLQALEATTVRAVAVRPGARTLRAVAQTERCVAVSTVSSAGATPLRIEVEPS